MIDPPLCFEDLYREYHNPVARYVEKMVGAVAAADVTQEVFAKIDRGLAQFDGRAKISTWIYRIATNTAVDWLRSSRKQQLEISLSGEMEDSLSCDAGVLNTAGTSSPPGLMIATEMNDCIRQQVDKLPEKYRTAIILCSLEELSTQEVAAILGVSIDTAKIRLHRGRAMLKAILENECRFYHTPATGNLACDRKSSGNC